MNFIVLHNGIPKGRTSSARIIGLAPGWEILPVVTPPTPQVTDVQIAYISGGHKSAADEWVEEWSIRDATADELTSKTEDQAARVARLTDDLYRTLPVELQAAFAVVYVACKDFIGRGQYPVAREIVSQVTVPADLEPLKQNIIDTIPES